MTRRKLGFGRRSAFGDGSSNMLMFGIIGAVIVIGVVAYFMMRGDETVAINPDPFDLTNQVVIGADPTGERALKLAELMNALSAKQPTMETVPTMEGDYIGLDNPYAGNIMNMEQQQI
jgi:hypothetical protein